MTQPSQTTDGRFTLRLDDNAHRQITELAESFACTRSAVVRHALRHGIETLQQMTLRRF